MNDKTSDTLQAQWARFRFAVIGPLLAAPPVDGELQATLKKLSKIQWTHPITNNPVFFSVSTIERWYYQAKKSESPMP